MMVLLLWLCAASRFSFKTYVYIRPKDALFKLPSFHHRGKRTIKGLLLLYAILNLDCTNFYTKVLGSNYEECGWAQALRDSGGAYSRDVQIQKPNDQDPKQPSTSPEQSPHQDNRLNLLLHCANESKRASY